MEGYREEKTCCEFEQNLVLKQEIYLTFNGWKPIAQCNICFSRQKTQYIFSINTRHITKAQTFFSVVFSRSIFRSKPNTIWKRRLFSIKLERFLVKILICKFIEFSLPGNYLKKTLVSPFKSANCLISNFVFYTTIALISRLRVLFFLYISRKRIINFIFKSVSIFFPWSCGIILQTCN